MENWLELDYNQSQPITKGSVLLSEPFMQDPNFERTAVLIVEHSAEGSVGFVLNRPSGVGVKEVVNDLDLNRDLNIGGPVDRDNLFYVHRIYNLEGAVPIADGYYWGGDFEDLRKRNDYGILEDEEIRFYAGYSGWGHEQLQEELNRRSWIVAHPPLQRLYAHSAEQLWAELLRQMGGRFKVVANFPRDPRMN